MRHVLFGTLVLGIFVTSGCGDDEPAPAVEGGGNVGHGGKVTGDAGGDARAGQAQAGDSAQGGAAASSSSEAGNGQGGAGDPAAGGGPPVVCNDGKGATLSGRVLSPSGELPLPGVSVYVSSTTVDALPNGASCWTCDSALMGTPVAITQTDIEGRFELSHVPVGAQVPLVVQTGKWQRKLELNVVDCQDNPVDEDASRLPSKRSEGNVPRMALVSGGEDTLECLLLKLGVDESEFAFDNSGGRVQLFSGKGGMTELDGVPTSTLLPATDLWSTTEALGIFDLVLLGSETDANAAAKPVAARKALRDYAAAGGRVLAQRFQSYFLEQGPADVSSVATFAAGAALADPFTAQVDVSSPRGQAFADWLAVVDTVGTAGELELSEGRSGVQAVTAPALRLLYGASPATVQAFSLDLPYGDAAERCGRITATDLATAAGDSVAAFPSGCSSSSLSPQELALIHLIFDLGACL